MVRVTLALLAALLTGVFAIGSAIAGDAKTIRIEPRAFYGATVSLESGVRVFRPVPPTTHMIINPNKTPINLSVKDVNKRVHKTSEHHYHGASAPRRGNYGVGGYVSGFKNARRNRRGNRRSARRNPDMSRR